MLDNVTLPGPGLQVVNTAMAQVCPSCLSEVCFIWRARRMSNNDWTVYAACFVSILAVWVVARLVNLPRGIVRRNHADPQALNRGAKAQAHGVAFTDSAISAMARTL
jgi:hypothetical protein